jgi:RNA polymerase sigma factor (sigma-70 family)
MNPADVEPPDRDRSGWLAERFEANRGHLRAVAYRMLGSLTEADDAVQEAWLRLSRADTSDVHNLSGWLTTVVARVCLNMLRTRRTRREEPIGVNGQLTVPEVPGPTASHAASADPEQEALLADSVGLALLVVLDALTPAERLAFVLHDLFAMPFDEIAPILERSPAAARQLASRARRRVRGHDPDAVPGADRHRQREVVDAFLAAARHGDFEALLAVLDPEVVLRADASAAATGRPAEIRGAATVAKGALVFSERSRFAQPALVNGTVGVVVAPRGRLFLVIDLTVADDRITEIDVIADPERLRQLDLAVLDD